MNQLDRITALTQELINRASVSPDDAGCQQLLADCLAPLGFEITHLPFEDVSNLWARTHFHDSDKPLFVFAGHTDVVPAGPDNEWHTPPFDPVIKDGVLYGRGAADMKGSLAAMVAAVETFLETHPKPAADIGFLITSDEEADAINGTVKVMEWLEQQHQNISWCLVGEPSSSQQVGDVVRVGRRGSLNGRLLVKGIQGHVAYPEQVRNPIHEAMSALAALAAESWDEGNDFFPATSMQMSNIHAGTGANNVVPGELEMLFNFRFSTESSAESLQHRTTEILNQSVLDYELQWALSGEPFLTTGGELIPAVEHAIQEVTGQNTELSTSGGTSDGRFIAPRGIQVVELGPVNATIHKVNECVSLNDLHELTRIYEKVLEHLLT